MNELTLDDSQPVELYEFSSSLGTHYFTSDVLDWLVDGELYESVTGLGRGAITIGSHDIEKDEIKITLPTTKQVAYDWAFSVHPPELKITIKRVDRADVTLTSYVIWRGRVSTITVRDFIATFNCPSRFVSILDGRVPTVTVQPQCNHTLFDELCGLNRATYTHVREVSVFFGDWIIFNGGALPASNPGLGANNDFINGEVMNLRTGETRTITKVNSTNDGLEINYEFAELLVGDNIEISQGCDHKRSSAYGCSRYSNSDNFGGFEHVPGEDRNIFQVGIT